MTSKSAAQAVAAELRTAAVPRMPRLGPRRPEFAQDALGWAMSAWTAAPGGADTSLDHLADAAMHGVRNSLSAILLGTHLLGRRDSTNGGQDVSGVIDHIAGAAARAHEQAEELADLGRLAAGRPICAVMRPLPLRSTVAKVVSDVRTTDHGGGLEHEHLGQGDFCHGDAARIAQFVRLALEEVASLQPATLRRTVISELSGTRFRISVHGAEQASARPPFAEVSRLTSASRRARMRAIAHAHQGSVDFGSATAPCAPAIEGWFEGAKLS